MSDKIDHPAHYGGDDNPYEAIKVIEAMGWGPDFCKGNAMKYLMRAGKKPNESEKDDLMKARFYIDRLIMEIDDAKAEKARNTEDSTLVSIPTELVRAFIFRSRSIDSNKSVDFTEFMRDYLRKADDRSRDEAMRNTLVSGARE